MICAMVVFYTIGYATQSRVVKPVYTTIQRATEMIIDPELINHWRDLGVYPVLRPCEV